MFSRPNGIAGDYYYYHAIKVTVYTTGTYSFTSSGFVDTYGCLYYYPFNPSYPYQNLITSDDDGADHGQFQISRNLQSWETYVLVVTTYRDRVTGDFSITGTGPALIGLTSIAPTESE
jgi:hypothetical protein